MSSNVSQAPAAPAAARRLLVAHVGSDPNVRGGMPAMLRDLLASPLGTMHDLEAIPTYRTPGRVSRLAVFAAGLARLTRWCLRPGPRLVHVHTAVRGSWYRKAIVVALVKALRRPVIVHLHVGTWDIVEFDKRIGPLRRAAFRSLFRSADRVVSVSSAGAREVARLYGRTDVDVIPNAVPASPPLEPAAPSRPGHPRILYLGGFYDRAKGGHVLVEAVPELLERLPGAELTMAGLGELPPEGRALVERHPGVRWRGWVDADEKRRLLAEADVFVLPSVSEGLPMALLEAMSHARAIVATAMGGVPDVMDDGVEGVLVAPGDPRALAEAIAALAADPERRARLATAAQARSAQLTPLAISERLDAVYQAVAPR